MRDNLEAVAEYAKVHVDFRAVFIGKRSLVPSDKFFTPPNQGHAAVAIYS